MARNIERDEREMIRRKESIIKAGLKLFAEYGIENVSLQRVADEAGVGVATVYNYFSSKVNLCIAISSWMWKRVVEETNVRVGKDKFENANAYEFVELYLEDIILIYTLHPEVLKFSSDYKTFICRESQMPSNVSEHLNVLKPINDLFHIAYEKAKVDNSIRTDIPENEMFTTVALTMLGMAERYTQGLVWAMSEDNDYTKELYNIKDMTLMWLKG